MAVLSGGADGTYNTDTCTGYSMSFSMGPSMSYFSFDMDLTIFSMSYSYSQHCASGCSDEAWDYVKQQDSDGLCSVLMTDDYNCLEPCGDGFILRLETMCNCGLDVFMRSYSFNQVIGDVVCSDDVCEDSFAALLDHKGAPESYSYSDIIDWIESTYCESPLSYSAMMPSMSYSMTTMFCMSYSMSCEDGFAEFTVEMYDSWGDGWNSVRSVVLVTVECSSG